MNELALFAGVGGGILGGALLGWRTVCAVERDAYAAAVLAQRQNDGCLAPFPIWSDVCSFDGRPWRGIVDVVSGGFPCQDISVAGKGAGINGARSGLWGEMARIIGEVRPRYVYVENSPMLVGRGLTRVIGDLTKMGYDAQWCIVSASDVGAPHKRDRLWILATDTEQRRLLAHTNDMRTGWGQQQSSRIEKTIDTNAYSVWKQQPQRFEREKWRRFSHFCAPISDPKSARFTSRANGQRQVQPWRGDWRRNRWWKAEPNVGRVADGVAARMDRLKAIANGQVPLVAAVAWWILTGAYDADEYV